MITMGKMVALRYSVISKYISLKAPYFYSIYFMVVQLFHLVHKMEHRERHVSEAIFHWKLCNM